MKKEWGLKKITKEGCKKYCEFGKFCEKGGSVYTEIHIIEKSKNLQLKKTFENCGADNKKSIIYIPTRKLKKRRF